MNKTKSYLEKIYVVSLRSTGITGWTTEWKFHPHRRWRFDVAWPDLKLAVEIEGGTYSKRGKSRHTTGEGFHEDCEKYNAAALLGWRVLRFDSRHVLSGDAVNVTIEAIITWTGNGGT